MPFTYSYEQELTLPCHSRRISSLTLRPICQYNLSRLFPWPQLSAQQYPSSLDTSFSAQSRLREDNSRSFVNSKVFPSFGSYRVQLWERNVNDNEIGLFWLSNEFTPAANNPAAEHSFSKQNLINYKQKYTC